MAVSSLSLRDERTDRPHGSGDIVGQERKDYRFARIRSRRQDVARCSTGMPFIEPLLIWMRLRNSSLSSENFVFQRPAAPPEREATADMSRTTVPASYGAGKSTKKPAETVLARKPASVDEPAAAVDRQSHGRRACPSAASALLSPRQELPVVDAIIFSRVSARNCRFRDWFPRLSPTAWGERVPPMTSSSLGRCGGDAAVAEAGIGAQKSRRGGYVGASFR